jgi:hypothetical protein
MNKVVVPSSPSVCDCDPSPARSASQSPLVSPNIKAFRTIDSKALGSYLDANSPLKRMNFKNNYLFGGDENDTA